jgi:aryl-alcohol dehydrogenase-like predicted oxidoreductase
MKYRKLGKRGPLVSALGLGCMGMSASYGPTDDATSLQVIQRAYDRGITFFDTADIYGNGVNEQLLGRAVRSFRDKITLATKCGIKFIGDECKIDNTPNYIRQSCEASLRRLGVEEIDLYYLHRYNPDMPLHESMGALLDLVKEGKIKHIGLSEVDAETLGKAHQILGDSLIALQTEYSIANAEFAETVLPSCRKLGISFIPYSPLGRGLLSGKINDAKAFKESTAVEYRALLPQFQSDVLTNNLFLIKAIETIAKRKKCTVAQLSLAWLLAQGDDIIPIPGTKKFEYLEENIGSLNVSLSNEDLELIQKARSENPVKGGRYPKELMELFHLKL